LKDVSVATSLFEDFLNETLKRQKHYCTSEQAMLNFLELVSAFIKAIAEDCILFDKLITLLHQIYG